MKIPIEHRPVTPGDFRIVFKILSGIDGQQRTADDIDTWMLAAQVGGWSRAQLAAACLALASTFTGFRVQPGHMTEQINRNRDKIRTVWYCPDPPRELAEDPAAEIEWRRRAALDFADRATAALATGVPLDEIPLTLESEPVRELVADGKARLRGLLDHAAAKMAVPELTSRPAGRVLDPERLAEARAELDRRRDAS